MKLKHHALVFKTISYYSIALILPLVITTYVYYSMLSIVEKDTYEAHLSVLKHSSEIVDKKLFDMEGTVVQLKSNYYIDLFVQLQSSFNDIANIPDILQVRDYLAPYSYANDFIDKILRFIPRKAIQLWVILLLLCGLNNIMGIRLK